MAHKHDAACEREVDAGTRPAAHKCVHAMPAYEGCHLCRTGR